MKSIKVRAAGQARETYKWSVFLKISVALKVNKYTDQTLKFTKFQIYLESMPQKDNLQEISSLTGKLTIGSDFLSAYSPSCDNTILQADTQPKREVSTFSNIFP